MNEIQKIQYDMLIELDQVCRKHGLTYYLAYGTCLGAVRDIQFAVEKLGIDDDCVVMAGDNVLDFSLCPFVSFALEKQTSCVMCHEENRLCAGGHGRPFILY